MEIAEKNYLISEIEKYDKQIEGLSWCVFGFVLIKSNKKNFVWLIISLIITVLLCIPAFVYLRKCNKRRKLIEEYVFKEHIENKSEIILSSIYSEIDYGMISNYIKKLAKNCYTFNLDRTRLCKTFIRYNEDVRLSDLKNELIILYNSNHYKSSKRRNEINEQIVRVLYQCLNKKTAKEICDYCNNELFVDNLSFNTIHHKYVEKVLKKISK